MTSFESRMVLDLLTPGARGQGFFEAVIQGRKLGNFDVVYDARAYEQMIAGQVTDAQRRHLVGHMDQLREPQPPGSARRPRPEEEILSYRIDATLDPALTMHCVTRMRSADDGGIHQCACRSIFPGQMRATSAKVDGVAGGSL